MNILFLNSLGKNKWGGGEKWMVLAAKGLSQRGHHVHIACLKDSVIEKNSKAADLNTWNYSIPADIAFWKAAPLRIFLKKNQIDVLVCCQNKDVKVGAKVARSLGTKAIFARQGVQNLSNKKRYIRPFTQFIDGIITNTQSIKRAYEQFGWVPENFIHVIYNGVVVSDTIQEIDIHQKFKIPASSKVIFSAGRLNYQKGFDLLVSVAGKAREKGYDWQFVVAGEGKLRNELIQSGKKAGVETMVHFIGFSDQIPALLKSSDIFVLPSRYEGMPNALLEAMSIGKASVATNVNGAPELVEDGISGFLVKPDNVEQLFEQIEQLLGDDKLRKKFEANALERVQRSFTVDRMIDQLEQLFQEQIAGSNK